jgi:hypothetical protein
MSTEELKEYFTQAENKIMEKVLSLKGHHSYEALLVFLEPLKKIYEEIQRRKEIKA